MKLKDLIDGVGGAAPRAGSGASQRVFPFASGWRNYYESFFNELEEALQKREYGKANRLLKQFYFYEYSDKIRKHFSVAEVESFMATVSRAEATVSKWLQRRAEKRDKKNRSNEEVVWNIDDLFSVAEKPIPKLTTMFQRLSEKYGQRRVAAALSEATGIEATTISEFIKRLDRVKITARRMDFSDYENVAVNEAIYKQVRDELLEAYEYAFGSEHASASRGEDAGDE